MRKVLFVLQDFGLGGTAVVWLRLIQALDRSRFTPQLVLMNARGSLLKDLPSDCEVFDLEKGARRGFPGAVVRYRSLERRLKPDVVIAALPNANILCGLARVGRPNAPPLIVTEHVAHFSYLGDPKHKFTAIGVRRLYRSAARVVAVSDGLRSELEAFYDLPADKLLRIYNPIDIEAIRVLAQAPLEADPGPGPLVVSVGRLADQKAPHDLISALALLRPQLDAKLIFVGDGPLRPALEADAKARGLGDRVTFVGSDANPFRWMARADVFASSSIFEGFSLNIAEAMCVGTPVVATDCPHGPRELLQGGRCGILVAPRQPQRLASSIMALIVDRARASEMARAASDRIREFDQAHVVEQYQELFDEVITSQVTT